MKKIFTLFFVWVSALSFAQSVLYFDDFETPNTFTLGTTSSNSWVVNDVYQGGVVELGFGINITIPNVPAQPSGITNPNGNYLHPLASFAAGEGILNASYELPFFGGGVMNAFMASTFSTVGYEDVTLSFWRTGGFNGVRIMYQVNGGAWQFSGHSFSGNVTGWQQETFVINAGDDVAQFAIGFEFSESTAQDPSGNHYHSIDDISITGTPIAGGNNAEISLTFILPTVAFCEGQEISADFVVSNGTINSGNQYTLELSDATGSFANPTVLATLASTQGSGTISGNLPAGTTGHNFRVRVNASDEAIIGNDNGTDFIIASTPDAPVVTQNTNLDLEVATNASSFEWLLNGDVIQNSQNQSSITPIVNGNYTVIASNDTCETVSNVFVVDFVNINEHSTLNTNLYPNPVSQQLNLTYDKSLVNEIYVTDVTGKVVFRTANKINNIDFSAQNKGLYFVHLVGKEVEIFKIVKQ
jgi:hypothetical protein